MTIHAKAFLFSCILFLTTAVSALSRANEVTCVMPKGNCSVVDAVVTDNSSDDIIGWIWQGVGSKKTFVPPNIRFAPNTHIRIVNIDKFKIWMLYGHDNTWKLLYWRSVKNDSMPVMIRFESGVDHVTFKETDIDLMLVKNPTILFGKNEFIEDLFFHDEPISNDRFFTRESLQLNQLFPQFARKIRAFINEARAKGFPITIAPQGGLRTFAEQKALYMKGRAFKNGKYVVVNKGQIVTKLLCSFHNTGLAVDMIFFRLDENSSPHMYYPSTSDPVWKNLSKIGLKYVTETGLFWHPFQDIPHWQQTMCKYVPAFQAMSDKTFRATLKSHYDKAGYSNTNGEYWFLFMTLQNYY